MAPTVVAVLVISVFAQALAAPNRCGSCQFGSHSWVNEDNSSQRSANLEDLTQQVETDINRSPNQLAFDNTRPGNWTDVNHYRTSDGHGKVYEEQGQRVDGSRRIRFYKKNFTSSYSNGNLGGLGETDLGGFDSSSGHSTGGVNGASRYYQNQDSSSRLTENNSAFNGQSTQQGSTVWDQRRPGNWSTANTYRTDGGNGRVYEERGQYVSGPSQTSFYKKNYTSSYTSGGPIPNIDQLRAGSQQQFDSFGREIHQTTQDSTNERYAQNNNGYHTQPSQDQNTLGTNSQQTYQHTSNFENQYVSGGSSVRDWESDNRRNQNSGYSTGSYGDSNGYDAQRTQEISVEQPGRIRPPPNTGSQTLQSYYNHLSQSQQAQYRRTYGTQGLDISGTSTDNMNGDDTQRTQEIFVEQPGRIRTPPNTGSQTLQSYYNHLSQSQQAEYRRIYGTQGLDISGTSTDNSNGYDTQRTQELSYVQRPGETRPIYSGSQTSHSQQEEYRHNYGSQGSSQSGISTGDVNNQQQYHQTGSYGTGRPSGRMQHYEQYATSSSSSSSSSHHPSINSGNNQYGSNQETQQTYNTHNNFGRTTDRNYDGTYGVQNGRLVTQGFDLGQMTQTADCADGINGQIPYEQSEHRRLYRRVAVPQPPTQQNEKWRIDEPYYVPHESLQPVINEGVIRPESSDLLAQQTEDLTQQTEDLTQQTQDLTQQSEDFTQQSEDLTQQTVDLTQQTEDLTQQTEDLTQQTEDLTQQTEDLTQQTVDLTQQSEDLTQQSEDLTQQSEDLTQQSEDLTQQTVDLTQQSEDFTQKSEDLTQQTEDLTQQTVDLTQQSEDLTQQTEDLTQQSEDLTQQTVDLTQQSEDFTQQSEDLTQQTVDLTQQSEDLTQQTEDLTQQSEDFTQQSDLTHQTVDLTQQSEDLTQQTEDFTHQTGSDAQRTEGLTQETEELSQVGNNDYFREQLTGMPELGQETSWNSYKPEMESQQFVGNVQQTEGFTQETEDLSQFGNEDYLLEQLTGKPGFGQESSWNSHKLETESQQTEDLHQANQFDQQEAFVNRGQVTNPAFKPAPKPNRLRPANPHHSQQINVEFEETTVSTADSQTTLQNYPQNNQEFESSKPVVPSVPHRGDQSIGGNFEEPEQTDIQVTPTEVTEHVSRYPDSFSHQTTSEGQFRPVQPTETKTSYRKGYRPRPQVNPPYPREEWHSRRDVTFNQEQPVKYVDETLLGQEAGQLIESSPTHQKLQTVDARVESRQQQTPQADRIVFPEEIESGKIEPRILLAYGAHGPYNANHAPNIYDSVKPKPTEILTPPDGVDAFEIHEVDHRVTTTTEAPTPPPTTTTTPAPTSATPAPSFWHKVGHSLTNTYEKAKEKASEWLG